MTPSTNMGMGETFVTRGVDVEKFDVTLNLLDQWFG